MNTEVLESGVEAGGRMVPVGRGMTRRWFIREGLAGSPGLSGGVVSRVLAARGLGEPASAEAFLEPKLTGLIDPALMPDIDKATERLLRALRDHEQIVIYGDYDVDGITSTAILYRTLKAILPGADVRTYVPHRLEEGYGLNGKAIELLAGHGAKVIVSVDCGITAVGPALIARRCGVDLIITDHHNPPASMADLPDAYAVVHPRRPDSAYPFGELSGAGVAYKLAWRLASADGVDGRAVPAMRTLLVELLALAALGAIADIVPLVGENRVLTKHGLARLKHSPFIGVRALVDACGLSGEKVGEYDVGFRLAPRLNACGRMDHAKHAIELFTSDDGTRCAEIAEQLESANRERRGVESEIVQQACVLAGLLGMTGSDRRAIVLADERWHAGVVGICCSRLVERFCRPTILMQIDAETGEAHGSCRSIEGYNLHAGLEACAVHLKRFGGHDMAAGVALHKESIPAFVEAFTAHANAHSEADRLTHALRIDAECSPSELTVPAVRRLLSLEPFGRGNPAIKLLLRGVTLASEPRRFGAGGPHLELSLGDGVRRVSATAWRWGEQASKLARGMKVDAVIEPKIDSYGGVHAAGVLVDLRAAT
ncbi:MAG: single-stranded-DNA-specific exonuclease RecJ [bacterium]